MHVDCGVQHYPLTKKGKPVKHSSLKCRLCFYCSNGDEVSDDEVVELPPSNGPGIVSKQIAQQRRDLLAGKKGIEGMMEAQAHSAGTLIIDDKGIDVQSAFIDATFRHWGWKTSAQFAKWAEAERNIIAEMKAEYNADMKNRIKKRADLVSQGRSIITTRE
jgi:hypothetical protein